MIDLLDDILKDIPEVPPKKKPAQPPAAEQKPAGKQKPAGEQQAPAEETAADEGEEQEEIPPAPGRNTGKTIHKFGKHFREVYGERKNPPKGAPEPG